MCEMAYNLTLSRKSGKVMLKISNVKEYIMNRLESLRNRMYEDGIDVVIMPNSDFHQSEYAAEYFGAVEFFSGFTGSNATVVVSAEDAVLYTDGRYYIQARKEIEPNGFRLMKENDADTPDIYEYVKSIVFDDATVAFDGRVVSAGFGINLSKALPSNINIVSDYDPSDVLWEDRPLLSKNKVWILDEKYSGMDIDRKIVRIRESMKKHNATVHIVSALDDIAWILNIRGNDIAYTPVVMAYLVIENNVVLLYSDMDKYDDDVRTYLDSHGVVLKDYDEFYEELDNLNNERVLLEVSKVNYQIYKKVTDSNQCVDKPNPSSYMKAVKNETELKNLKNVHIKDGLAVTRFILWLKEHTHDGLTEYDLSEKLHEFRSANDGFIEESFETISAYGANAALMHYRCSKESAALTEARGMLLVDSGGQYYEGTTDVTRTIALGPVTEEEKKMYTLSLKGMFELLNARFLQGCTGVNLDILARRALWEVGCDYKCGTGHGVSYLLGVHEGPNSIRWKRRSDDCVFEPGMVTSNEPGFYKEGAYGVRIENEMVCKKICDNEYGTFLGFENLTYVPIDLELIDKKYMSAIDIDRVLSYNNQVYEVLEPFMDAHERDLYLKLSVLL